MNVLTLKKVAAMAEEIEQSTGVSRRTLFRLGAAGGVGAALAGASVGAPYLSQNGLLSPDGAFAATSTELADTCSTPRRSRPAR